MKSDAIIFPADLRDFHDRERVNSICSIFLHREYCETLAVSMSLVVEKRRKNRDKLMPNESKDFPVQSIFVLRNINNHRALYRRGG